MRPPVSGEAPQESNSEAQGKDHQKLQIPDHRAYVATN